MNGVPERLATALADRYQIERELGRGGMAIVYLAEDLRYHRQVAIKVLKPELAHAVGADRFLTEVQITAQLNHPHILPLLDSGETDGFLYYVMPYVAGESLRDRLDREGPLPIEEALRIAEQVASALEHAHRQDVIHRDIKPENILLHEGEAMVADFGIAVAVTVAGGERVTETGIAVGTPAFMSPEQASGDRAIDERSDIYSLGCVVYEMVGGEVPHTGSTPREILAHKVLGEAKSIRELRPEADEALEAVLARALEAAPEDRFATAAEFGEALRSPEVGWTLAAKRQRRRRRRVAAAMAAGLVVLALGVGAVLQYVGGIELLFRPAAAGFVEPEDCIVVAEFENQTDRPHLGVTVRDQVAADLSQAGYVTVLGFEQLRETLGRMRLPDTTYVDRGLAVEIARRDNCPVAISGSVAPLGTGYSLTAAILEVSTEMEVVRPSETAANDTLVIGAVELLARKVRRHLGESLPSIRRSEPLAYATTNSLDALEYFTLGVRRWNVHADPMGAIPFFEQAVTLDTAFASAYRRLSSLYFNLNPVRSRHYADLAYRFRERLPSWERALLVPAYHWTNGRFDSAVYYLRVGAERNPNSRITRHNLAWAYYRMGRFEEALEAQLEVAGMRDYWGDGVHVAAYSRVLSRHALADSALAFLRERVSPDHNSVFTATAMNAYYGGNLLLVDSLAREGHPDLPYQTLHLRAGLAAMYGRVNKALALADSAARRALEANALTYARRSLQLTEYASLAAGVPERALPFLEESRSRLTLGTLSEEHSLLGQVACGYALAGDFQSAQELLADMDSLIEGEHFHSTGIGEQVLAVIELREGRWENAVELLRRARTAEFGLHRWEIRLLLADAQAAQGQLDEAIAQYDTLTGTNRLHFEDVPVSFPLRPLAHERLGSLHLQVGDTVSAARHLAEFIELWKDADPELQPRVEAARRRLGQLAGEAGT
jgi:serine/threonine-protein kinase